MIAAAVTEFLSTELGGELAAAFIYGSVATGDVHGGSDIDCFVITTEELPAETRQRLQSGFAEVQRGLGYNPDPDYPIEVFSVAACTAILDGSELRSILDRASSAETVTPEEMESDEVEVLRALLDSRLAIRPADVLDMLTARARELAGRDAAASARLRRTLKLAPLTAPEPAGRLVDSPVFILSSIRSGSTLLRCMLNSHSEIHAPHELHLTDLSVRADTPFAALALEVAGLGERELEHMLWDGVLHRELANSGKRIVVDKTPANVLRWRRIAECWPSARYIFLRRHPVHVVESAIAARPHASAADSKDLVKLFLTAMAEATEALPGRTVSYEDLVTDPTHVVRDLCEFLAVDWQPAMLDYGQRDHGPYISGIGDFTDRIKSGRVQSGRPVPRRGDVPDDLLAHCDALGYG